MKLRQTLQTVLFSLTACLAVQPALCEHPDLSGSWQLDVAASIFGTAPTPESGMLTISTGPHKMFHMALTMKGPSDKGILERTTESDWKVDNRYHPVIGDGESGEVLAKWDGPVLLGKRQTSAGPEEIRIIADSGGATMTETIQSAQGTKTLIWRRR
jgi:hypothetical protein